MIPLELLPPGEIAEVVDVHGDPRLAARLAENGLRVGCLVETVVAGNPLVVRIGESKLSLRTDGQVQILVRMATPTKN
jgi:Fe2+ transport system protein FeoA